MTYYFVKPFNMALQCLIAGEIKGMEALDRSNWLNLENEILKYLE